MKPDRKLKIALGVVTALVLVGVIAMGTQQTTDETTAAVERAAGTEGYADQCATCPLRNTDECACDSGECTTGPCAVVDAERCVGCARCVRVAPEAFRMNPETGRAEVIDGASVEDIERGAQACPVKAISVK